MRFFNLLLLLVLLQTGYSVLYIKYEKQLHDGSEWNTTKSVKVWWPAEDFVTVLFAFTNIHCITSLSCTDYALR